MLRLCGFRISNYHNKVRIALLEKGIEHEEDSTCRPSQAEDFLARSPVGKVPFLELHVELVARRPRGQVFFGKEPSQSAKQSVERELAKGLKGLRQLVKFDPFIAGSELTIADCVAFCHLPLVSLSTKIAYGRDFLEDMPQVRPYIAMLKQRPAFARVDEDRKAAQKK